MNSARSLQATRLEKVETYPHLFGNRLKAIRVDQGGSLLLTDKNGESTPMNVLQGERLDVAGPWTATSGDAIIIGMY